MTPEELKNMNGVLSCITCWRDDSESGYSTELIINGSTHECITVATEMLLQVVEVITTDEDDNIGDMDLLLAILMTEKIMKEGFMALAKKLVGHNNNQQEETQQ